MQGSNPDGLKRRNLDIFEECQRTGADPYAFFKYLISFPQLKYIKFNINEKLYLKNNE